MIVAEPRPLRVTDGCWAGAVAPAGIKTVADETSRTAGSLAVMVSVTPPAGAGTDNRTPSGADSPRPKLKVGGRMMVAMILTVTLIGFDEAPGPNARMKVDPAAVPVIGKVMLVTPRGNRSDDGRVNTLSFVEVRFTVNG